MCGIANFCNFIKKSTIENLDLMMQIIAHRGADANGHTFHFFRNSSVGVFYEQ